MWQIRVLARLAHGELPAETFVGCIWLFDLVEGAVQLTPDRTRAKPFALESEVFATTRNQALKYYVLRVVKDDEDNGDHENSERMA